MKRLELLLGGTVIAIVLSVGIFFSATARDDSFNHWIIRSQNICGFGYLIIHRGDWFGRSNQDEPSLCIPYKLSNSNGTK